MKAPNEIIIDYLKSELFKTYFPGDKIPSEAQLAKMFSVSRLTARKAVQKLVNEEILVSVQGLGTYVTEFAGSPKRNMKKVMALLPSSYTTRNWMIAAGIFSTIDKFNISPVMVNAFLEDLSILKKQIKTALSQNFSGIIMLPYLEVLKLPVVKKLIDENFPILFVDRYIDGYDIPSVVSDAVKGAYQLGKHMRKAHNLTKALFITREDIVIGSIKDRYEGFQKGIGKHVDFKVTDLNFKQIDQTVPEIKAGKYECVAFSHDNLALRGLTVFQRAGIKVPEEVKIIGFDDKSASRYTSPRITTAKQNFTEIGESAALMMSRMLRNESVPSISTVPMEIIIRESCGCEEEIK